MNNKKIAIRPNLKTSAKKRPGDVPIAWEEGRIVSNDTSLFASGAIGISKEVIRPTQRKDCLSMMLNDLKQVFGLSDTQLTIMTAILTSAYYRDEIKWDIETIVQISHSTGLSIETLRHTFPSLHLKKKLLIKTKNGLYKINKAVLYHSSDLQNVDVVQLVLTYRVQDAKIKAVDFLKDGTALTDEFVDEVLMLAERVKSYQNKRAREEEKKKKEEAERLAEQKEREEALKKNKWA